MVESTTSNSTQKKVENAAAEDEDMIIESSEKI